jgi:hypothetical protein
MHGRISCGFFYARNNIYCVIGGGVGESKGSPLFSVSNGNAHPTLVYLFSMSIENDRSNQYETGNLAMSSHIQNSGNSSRYQTTPSENPPKIQRFKRLRHSFLLLIYFFPNPSAFPDASFCEVQI